MRSPIGSANSALLALRDSMTPGQRWTATLSVTLALLVLVYGAPTRVGPPSAYAGDAGLGVQEPVAAPPASAPVPAAAPVENGAGPAPAVPPAVGGAAAPLPAAAPAPAALAPVAGPPAPAGPVRVVAAVRAGEQALPGRDDASIAQVFLRREGLEATVVPVTPGDPAACSTVGAAGDLVVASRGLEPAVTECLTALGRTVLSFDAAGTRLPFALSTRRGFTDSLLDLAAAARDGDTLPGKVGIVVAKSSAETFRAAGPALAAAGVEPAKVAEVADDADRSALLPQVQSFVQAGIATVLFAAPVGVQGRWAEQHSVLDPSVRYVVSDTYDSVLNESYPPVMNGARSQSSMRVPWQPRQTGETPEQADCRTTFTASVTPPVLAAGEETVRVFAWCQHALLAALAVREGIAALTSARLESPLTSALGPLPGGGFGPAEDASLTWQIDCRCWRSTEGFRPRATGSVP